jgi:hypothetical protein
MRIFGYEPAVILYSINAGVALLVAYGLPLSQGQVAAISTIATALLTVVTAAMTRPVPVSALTAAVGTGLAAAAAFGLNLSADQIGTTVAALSIVLALVLRANVSPAQASPGHPGAHAGRDLSAL